MQDGRGVIREGTLLERRYRVDKVVAEGGFGQVYRGIHLTLEIPIAIKVMRLRGRDSEVPELCAQFLEEARILSRLRHPNIVRILDAGLSTESGAPPRAWLVMEWCGGQTLRDHLGDLASPYGVLEVWSLLSPLLDAVAVAHAQGVAHRDIKLSNIMVVTDDDGATSARLIDFGISKRVDAGETPGSGSTRSTGPRGFTPGYAAPEQLTGARSGPWTDVHALALVITEMLIGQSPYGNNVEPSAIVDPVRPTPSRFGIDAGAWEIVLQRALALKSADRYPDARALLDALREALPHASATPNKVDLTPLPKPAQGARERERERKEERPSGAVADRTELETLEHAATERLAAPRIRAPRRSILLWAIPVGVVAAASLAFMAIRRDSPLPEASPSAMAAPNAPSSAPPDVPVGLSVPVVAPPSPASSSSASPSVPARSSAEVRPAPPRLARAAPHASASAVAPAPPPPIASQAPERPTLH